MKKDFISWQPCRSKKPAAAENQRELDFGKGFYTTTDFESGKGLGAQNREDSEKRGGLCQRLHVRRRAFEILAHAEI